MNIYCNRCGFCSANDAGFCQKCGAAFGSTSSVPAISPPAPGALPHYAGFWIRVVAAILDFLLLVAVAFVLRMAVGSAFTVLTMDSRLPLHEVFVLRRIIRIAISVAGCLGLQSWHGELAISGYLGKVGDAPESYRPRGPPDLTRTCNRKVFRQIPLSRGAGTRLCNGGVRR